MSLSTPDVCIVGAGALGLYLAHRLSDAGMAVLLLDVPNDADASMKATVVALGTPKHRGSAEGWKTGLGGTTQLWGGQLWPWESPEFLGYSGYAREAWPEAAAYSVRRKYQAVMDHLGLPRAHAEIHAGMLVAKQDNGGLRRGYVRHSTWMNRHQRQFAKNRSLSQARARVSLAPLTVSRVEPSRGGWLVSGNDKNGGLVTFRSARLVLAAGTLGNFAILARSGYGASDGLGLGFMDHVSSPVAEFRIVRPERFRRLAAPAFHGGVLGSPRLMPAHDSSRSALGYGHWEIAVPPWVPLQEVKASLSSGRPFALFGAAAQASGHFRELGGALASAALWRQRPVIGSSVVRLRVDVQQPTHERNRLQFRDGQVVVSWSVRDREAEAIDAVAEELIRDLDLDALGLELTDVPERSPEDIFHMMGGTALGGPIVDEHSRIRQAPGAYVVGPGVFPSGGLANPTLTALALSESVAEEMCDG